MRIVVCAKQVLYAGGAFEIDPQTNRAYPKDTEPIHMTNRIDRSGLEEALRLKNEIGGEVISITFGPPGAAAAVYTCLASGADRGIHLIRDESIANDAFITALALSRAVADLGCDMIMCGTRSSDEGSWQVPPMMAELLSLPQVTSVIKMEVCAGGKKVRAVRRLERGKREVVECLLPAVIGVEAAIREPRYISVRAHLAATRTEIETPPMKSLLKGSEETTPLTRLVSFSPPRPRPKKLAQPDASMDVADRINFILSGGMAKKEDSKLIDGPPEKMATQVIEILKREGAIKIP